MCVCVRVSHFWRSEEWHELFRAPLPWLGTKKGRMREEERKKGRRGGSGKQENWRRQGESGTEKRDCWFLTLTDAKGGAV